ncbi:MAG: TMEM43 family protein [Nitrospinota bacterium]|nr:TMEM43 family protein [Nitrospinota bacterium]
MRGEFGGSKAKTGHSASSGGSSSGGGFIVGLLMFIASFPLLFWNEGSAVKAAKALDEGKGIVVSLANANPEAGNEGKLVHFTGMATTAETLKDNLTGVSVQALKLYRKAEMYQWKENKEEKKDRTDYYYEKVWSESHISSDGFFNKSYVNPDQMKVQSDTFKATEVTVGEFALSSNLINMISASSHYPISDEIYRQLPPDVRRDAKLSGGLLYYGVDPANPRVGDIQVQYVIFTEQPVSVVAKQQNGMAATYVTSNGRTLELLYPGTQSAEQIFASEETQLAIFTWLLRGGGMLLMYIGLMMSIGQLARLFSWIPILGSIVESGVAIMVGLLSIGLSFLVISIGWIFYRPLVGGGLLLVSAAAIYIMMARSKSHSQNSFDDDSAVPPPPPPIPR